MPVFAPAVQHGHLQRAQRGARVAVCKGGYHGKALAVYLHALPAEAAFVCQRAAQHSRHLCGGKRLQHEHLAAREQGRVYLERGVFSGGADEHDAAALHIGQKGVLLCLVEAVYLVHKQNGLLPETSHVLRALHHGLYLLHAAGHSRKIHKLRLCAARNNACQRSFAHTRRAPEYHAGHVVGINKLAQNFPLAQKLLLPEKFLQRARAHAAGQRPRHLAAEKRLLLHVHPPFLPRHTGAAKYILCQALRPVLCLSIANKAKLCYTGECEILRFRRGGAPRRKRPQKDGRRRAAWPTALQSRTGTP